MVFGPQISTKSLERTCRSLSTLLESGVSIVKALVVSGRRTQDPRCRRALEAVADEVKQGEEVSAAMDKQAGRFPSLMIEMVRLSESSGALPEVLKHLAEHYEKTIRLRRNFILSITWPVIQLLAAILVIALLLFVLGVISKNPIDLFGVGTGLQGAILWLVLSLGSLTSLIGGFFLAKRSLVGQKFFDPFLLRLPVIGNCLQSFAVARFSWAFYLTQQTGMPIYRSLATSLRATGNGAFIGATRGICAAVEEGESLSTALSGPDVFPEEFVEMVAVAETSGTVPEQLHRLSPQFDDQARRSLNILTSAMGVLIWMFIAGVIIFAVFRIFMTAYLGPLNEMLDEVNSM